MVLVVLVGDTNVHVKEQGACIRGGRMGYCPASNALHRRLRISFDSFKVERGETKTRRQAPPFLTPSLFVGGEKTNPSHRTVVAGFGSLSVQGGREAGRQAV